MFKESSWGKYTLVPTTKGYDSILEHVLVESPDFDDLEAITDQIEQGMLEFVADVDAFLAENEK